MLDWLKEILGDNYSDEVDKGVAKKIGELFVTKADFNKKLEDIKAKDGQLSDLNGQIKDRDKQLDELKKVDKEGLEKKIQELQDLNKNTKTEYDVKIAKMVLDSAVDSAVAASGAKDSISVRAHLAKFLEDAKVAEDGKVVGLSEEIENLKKGESTSFLFATESKPGIAGAKAAESGAGGAPPTGEVKKPEEMTYEDFVKDAESGQK